MNLIEEYNDILSLKDCKSIIEEISRREKYKDVVYWAGKTNDESLENLNEIFLNKTKKSVTEYLKKSGGLVQFESLSLAGFALVTQPNGYSDGLHHDIETVVNEDNIRIRAFVSLIYLNEDYIGGQLVFPTHKKIIEPKAGKLAIFPASYLFPHYVLNLSGNDRMFVRLHYLMKQEMQDKDLDESYNKK